MDRTSRPDEPLAADAPPWSEAAALEDAGDIVDRSAADQEAADEARVRFRRDGLPTFPPDERIAPYLESDERIVAVRHAALLDRREPPPGTRPGPGLAGELYVTSRRLVLVGRLTLQFELAAIADAVVSGERLLLVLQDGRGVALQISQPRLLCVEIAAARAAARSAQASGSATPPRPASR